MGCFNYQMRDLHIGCTVANGGIMRMVAIDRTAIQQYLGEGKGIEPKVNAKKGQGYIEFSDDALAACLENAFKVEVKKNSLSVQATMNDDQTWQNQITPLKVAGVDRETHAVVQAMCDNDMCYLVEDRNNKVIFMGYYAPVVLESGTYNSGTAVTDDNGYELTLTERNPECIFEGADATGVNLSGNAKYKDFWA